MTLFLNYIQNIKTKWISTILRLFCLLHDMFCLLGFFVFPIFKYSSSLRIPFLIVVQSVKSFTSFSKALRLTV